MSNSFDQPTPEIHHTTSHLSDAANEPRVWSRLECGSAEIAVPLQTLHGETRDATLLDKSLGGIGVRIADEKWFSIGEEIIVTFYSAPVRAYVRQLRQLTDGTWRLGLEWKGSIFE